MARNAPRWRSPGAQRHGRRRLRWRLRHGIDRGQISHWSNNLTPALPHVVAVGIQLRAPLPFLRRAPLQRALHMFSRPRIILHHASFCIHINYSITTHWHLSCHVVHYCTIHPTRHFKVASSSDTPCIYTHTPINLIISARMSEKSLMDVKFVPVRGRSKYEAFPKRCALAQALGVWGFAQKHWSTATEHANVDHMARIATMPTVTQNCRYAWMTAVPFELESAVDTSV
ncbi:hypothetical protein EI94DRAFT_774211 [Lactarius quietus]|nr:hypothetical protein EI94DRAFT_774211 [Lactarius quietus]